MSISVGTYILITLVLLRSEKLSMFTFKVNLRFKDKDAVYNVLYYFNLFSNANVNNVNIDLSHPVMILLIPALLTCHCIPFPFHTHHVVPVFQILPHLPLFCPLAFSLHPYRHESVCHFWQSVLVFRRATLKKPVPDHHLSDPHHVLWLSTPPHH